MVCAAGLGAGERKFGKNGFRRVREALVLIAKQGLPAAGQATPPGADPTTDADDVERHPWPRCGARPGSPCRSRSAAVAGI